MIVAGILADQEERLQGAADDAGLVVTDRICERAQAGARRWPVLMTAKKEVKAESR